MPDPNGDYTVRALWENPGGGLGRWPHYLTACPSLMQALHLAQNVREIFGCAVWIEDFDRPASLPILRVRAVIEARDLLAEA